MTRRHLLSVLTLMSLVFVFLGTVGVSPIHAADAKIYPGSMCVRYDGTNTPGYNFSAIGNPSDSTWLLLDCPIVRDHTDRTISSGVVQVIDLHFSEQVYCSLNSFYRSGDAFLGWWTQPKASSGTSTGQQTLSFGGVGSNSLAHYYYSCGIPPKYNGQVSYIISYKVNENQ